MKTSLLSLLSTGLFLCCAGLISPSGAQANLLSAGIDLGAADHNATRGWAIFTLGSTSGGSDVIDTASGNVSIGGVNGALADFGAAGAGKVDFSGNVGLTGDLYYKSTGSLKTNGNSKIVGTVRHDTTSDAQLNKGVTDAINASNKASALPASAGYPTTISTNKSLSLSGTGNVVLKLTDFSLSGGATLTLVGTATTAFIINVSNTFSLDSGNVVLSGGLTWDNVLFNVRNSGTASMSGNSSLTGVILATGRTFKASGNVTVTGEVIADKVNLSGGFNLKRPPHASH